MAGAFRLEVLRAEHDRKVFSCGVQPLDRYFQEQATQDIRRRVSACYVAIHEATFAIAGYYTLAASGRPPNCRSTLPWKKLGSALLWDAVLRATRSEIAAFALVVDAKDDVAANFYRYHGFVALDDEQRR